MVIALIALLMAGDAEWAAPLERSPARVPVTVWIYDGTGVAVDDITAARAEADTILREAGIAPAWVNCALVAGKWWSANANCESGVGPDALIVRLLQSPPDEPAGNRTPLGEARVDLQAHLGSIATVYADRVAGTAKRAGAEMHDVLGRVIAHEIGHLLMGTSHHSLLGLMRPVWTDLELRRAIGLEWHFSKSEARCMRFGIAVRSDLSIVPDFARGGECDPTRRPSSPAKPSPEQ